ncbi:DUF6607 family protein [Hyphomonas sp.]|uniref:DUF6607 family protein n=1 Tax=Hyphomonas sp. TaxID=87 RepID=UPI00391A6E17
MARFSLRPAASLMLAATLTFGLPASASAETAAQVSAEAQAQANPGASFERDRQAILAMAGDYRVTFDFIETVAFREGYSLKPQKLSGALEAVRVIEDRGDFISLQHILIIPAGGQRMVLKHWRQDWQYEPERVLEFTGANAWAWRDVPQAERRGTWSQTVYQVEDAPRYSAVAAWDYAFGTPTWAPPHEWRPLPRRDMTTRDDYHAINAVNRHVITPAGWVHEQDNDKLDLATGAPQLIAREIGVNTYNRLEGADLSLADKYWAATADYWAGVRAEWARIAAEGPRFGLTVQGETEELYNPLLALGDEVAAGRRETALAVAEARGIVRSYVTHELAPLAERVALTPPVGEGS